MVIVDTSPLNYLILLDADAVLPKLYGEIVVPKAVLSELHHTDTPPAVAQWIVSRPAWLKISDVREIKDETLDDLGAGEREAITLAQDFCTEALLVIDERRGRSEALRRGIVTTGTLGVLDAAAEAALVDLPTLLNQLRRTTFYASPLLLKRLLERDALRRSGRFERKTP